MSELNWERKFVRVDRKGNIDTAALPTFRNNMSIDYEATGTDIYARDFAPRLCQVSFDGYYAYVLNAERHHSFIVELVNAVERIIVHNGSYDLVVLDRHYDIPLELTWPKTADTQEMARLLYPTESEALKDLARKDLDVEVDSDKALREEFKRLKLRPLAAGYALVPLDNEVYVRYAGLDAIYTFRLWEIWNARVNKQLLNAEHSLQYQTAAITRRGLLCDKKETKKQLAILDAGIDSAARRLDEVGVPLKVDTNEGREIIGEWFDYMEIPIAYSEKSVQNYIDKHGTIPEEDDLYHCMKIGADDLRLATMEAPEDVKAVIADLIFIRQAEKIKTAYLESFLESAEVDGRVHATIRTMAARTHRMSISGPPLQQIPSHPIEIELTDEEWEELQPILEAIENED